MKKAVLVTGGAGYIGSHICKLLDKNGYFPIVIDNLMHGDEKFVRWGPLIKGDVGDRNLLKSVFQTYFPFAVIHCAACICLRESFQSPELYYRNNFVESLVLLENLM